jgi:hypothetical protein
LSSFAHRKTHKRTQFLGSTPSRTVVVLTTETGLWTCTLAA